MDLSSLVVSATKPKGKPAVLLAESGVRIAPIEEDEGDVDRYVLSRRLVIERRTGSGFLRGIMDKTLFTSALYLREHFRLPVLIIEGQVNYEHTRFDPQAVRGALSSMVLLYGMTVLSTATVEETVALITMMARQEQVAIPEISLIPKRKADDLPDLQRRLIEMLPGCGRVLARDLLQHFGSVRRIIDASEEELCGLRGLGTRKAKAIRQVLHAEYEAVDTEKNIEDAIEAEPRLLFKQPVTLLARQLYIYTEAGERHVVDMAFLDSAAEELILVELKRGVLNASHAAQLRRYLDRAGESKLLRPLLDAGARRRGVLATVEPCRCPSGDADISARVLDRSGLIAVLKALRRDRLAT